MNKACSLVLSFSLFMVANGSSLHKDTAQPHVITLDKQALIEHIKSDLYRIFVLQMGIIDKDWSYIAQNDLNLEKDLQQLYYYFNCAGQSKAQKELDKFCETWKLESIKIADIYLDLEHKGDFKPSTIALDKRALIDQIKSDLYKVFVLEMGILDKDWSYIAQNNLNLEKDLKQLYCYFNRANQNEVQKELDKFCKTWELECIKIADIRF